MSLYNRFDPDRERPSVWPVLLRVILLVAILAIVLIFQHELGHGPATCMRAFGVH